MIEDRFTVTGRYRLRYRYRDALGGASSGSDGLPGSSPTTRPPSKTGLTCEKYRAESLVRAKTIPARASMRDLHRRCPNSLTTSENLTYLGPCSFRVTSISRHVAVLRNLQARVSYLYGHGLPRRRLLDPLLHL